MASSGWVAPGSTSSGEVGVVPGSTPAGPDGVPVMSAPPPATGGGGLSPIDIGKSIIQSGFGIAGVADIPGILPAMGGVVGQVAGSAIDAATGAVTSKVSAGVRGFMTTYAVDIFLGFVAIAMIYALVTGGGNIVVDTAQTARRVAVDSAEVA